MYGLGTSTLAITSYQMTLFCFHSNMPSLDVMTITRQCLFSEAWNATDDFFEEPQSGLVHKLLGIKDNGMQVYDRCGQLVGEIKLFPKIPDMKHEW